MESMQITHKKIEEFCVLHSTPPSLAQQELIPATRIFSPMAFQMQVGPLEGKFLALIAKLMNAKNVLEFGTFTGYSALAFAEALPKSGRVTTLDRDPRATRVAQEYWKKSGFSEKIEFILGEAEDSVQRLESEVSAQVRPLYDLAFIDADKTGYPQYWEASLKLVRKGGAILVDNVLWSGEVLNPEDDTTRAIVAFNSMVSRDSRVEKVMLPIRDGIYLAVIL